MALPPPGPSTASRGEMGCKAGSSSTGGREGEIQGWGWAPSDGVELVVVEHQVLQGYLGGL